MNQEYVYGMWAVVTFNIGLLLFFYVSFLPPKGKLVWRNLGLVTAFLVALFSEMYGFPLMIYLLTGLLGDTYPVLQPFSHMFGHLWAVVFGGSDLARAFVMGLSLVFMLAGYLLLSKGWRQIYGSRGKLITNGVYAYVRHPQYTGLILIIVGFLIQWPTLLTVLMAPVLITAYIDLSRYEEKAMLHEYGSSYDKYMISLPMLFPPLSKWREFILTSSEGGSIN